MAPPSRYYAKLPYPVTKTITFDGTAGNGAVGTVNVFLITGQAVLAYCYATCSETLVGATATVLLRFADGVVIIPQTTATDIAANDMWVDATPEEAVGAALSASQKDIAMNGQATGALIVIAVGTAAVTDGTLTIHALYYPISSGSALDPA